MSRKVFLAFLGSNDYLECNYYYKDKKSENVKYVQEAVADFFCNDWKASDKILIFTTKVSREKHWENLSKVLDKFDCSVSNVNIPDCSNEEELWDMFDLMVDNINEEDEIIFDITHGFRLMPLFAISAINYLESIKKVKVKGIYYGAFETLGVIKKVEKLKVQDRNVPIFDLTTTHLVQKWAKAVEIFEETGRSNRIADLGLKDVSLVLKETKGKDEQAKELKKIINQIFKITRNIRSSRSKEIIDMDFNSLKKNIAEIKNQDVIRALKPVLEKIEDNFQNFGNGNEIISNSFAIIEWCIKYDLIQQGYSYLIETIYSFLFRLYDKNFDLWNKTKREHLSNVLNFGIKEISEGSNELFIDLLLNKIGESFDKKDFCSKIRSLQDYRNDINHCGFRKESHEVKILKDKLEAYFKYFKDILL